MQNINIDTIIEINNKFIEYYLSSFNDINYKKIDLQKLISELLERLPKTLKYIEFLNFVSDYCASKTSFHPEFNKLASHICISKLHKITYDDINIIADKLYFHYDVHNKHYPLISEKLYITYKKYSEQINKIIDYNRDYEIDYFGIKTLEKSYLMKIQNKNSKFEIIERPQHLFMRVAFGIHEDDYESAIETYENLSKRYFTHATPTLFNAGTNKMQMSSCFLLACGDSMESIMENQKEMALISKSSGGIGVHFTSVRSKGSLIRGTNGLSDGIIPLCIYTCKLSRYVNQGGKRGGAISIYLEPWHSDVYEFCELRIANTGNDDNRARDLFIALWICDLFMKRVEADEMWSLMCPDECPNLNKTHGEEFEELYIKYEQEKRYKRQVKARDLFEHILNCQLSSGMPYIAFKDNANNKSNQKNLGTISSSNLCIEIVEYSDEKETAVCNLASICLSRFVETNENNVKTYNFSKLQNIARICIRNLNKVIDLNYYPTEKTRLSNMRHRPVGLGVQGLADVYNLMGLPFESEEAMKLNKQIFESIYYASVDESCKLAEINGHYETFLNSPFSKGQLQYHLWGLDNQSLETKDLYDWDGLVERVKHYGTRNSLLTALMPTASTSQIMKCSECFEPYMSNIFTRTTLAGEFIIINENLIKDLEENNLWNDDMRENIIIHKGSIQKIDNIPQKIKDIYKTAYEIKLKSIISQSADRGAFIDQSQSMNLFLEEQDRIKLRSALFYGWKRGLKTGMYYLRSTPAVDALNFGIDIDKLKKRPSVAEKEEEMKSCRKVKGCVVCGS